MTRLTLALALVLASGAPVEAAAWHIARIAPWFGPGFYGGVTACGIVYTRHTRGVAHRTLPCGTRVVLRWGGRTVTTRVIDRGPWPRPALRAAMPFDLSARTSCWDLQGDDSHYVKGGCATLRDVRYRVLP